MSTSNVGKFNTQLDNMLEDLITQFPEDNSDVKLFREKFSLARKANSRLVVEVFIKHVYQPYKQQIMEKNEAFFLRDEMLDEVTKMDDLKALPNVNNDYIITKALNFKKMWGKMEAEDKETIWKYFQVLIILAERFLKENHKT